jgi:nucleoside-diphosphate-sugar epimerase
MFWEDNLKRIVITGPTGAIGMALIKECIDNKISAVAICHKGSMRIRQIPKSEYITVIETDLACLRDLDVKGIKADIFYHFAWAGTTGEARNDMPLQINNIQYAIDAVELAYRLKCTTFIGAGSQAEYGRSEKLLTPQAPTFPENGYGMAKLCAGQMTRQHCAELGIKHIWARILSVYGPNDTTNSMVMSTVNKLVNGERVSLTLGEQKWDYLYSLDAARAMLLLGEKGVNGKTYVIGSGNVRPLREYIYDINDAIIEMFGKSGTLGLGDIQYSDKQVMYLGADISDLKQDTGFEPLVEFKDGIRYILESFENKV